MRLWLWKFVQKIGGVKSVYLSRFGEIRDISWILVFPVVILKANIIENVLIFWSDMQ